ncbi:hypothetical protein UCDDS831_g00823 [Diplodia seriata]|uniref:Uncharacterized protein n=1 Tax=Diplodia seriata TaxID=420778 RepID=A0A0G2EZD8_9PEZI|nr:hypothetical protein UCDDS831_g00823 [Diplodia seriata]
MWYIQLLDLNFEPGLLAIKSPEGGGVGIELLHSRRPVTGCTYMPASTPLLPFAPAFVEWHCPEQNATAYLGHRHPRPPCQLTLEIRFGEAESAAFFKLRTSVALKACAKKTNVLAFILPDRIFSLHGEADPDLDTTIVPATVRRGLTHAKACFPSDPICSLRFTLSKPPVIVIPAATSLAPATTASGDILNALKSFAQATEFTVYFARKQLPQELLKSLCTLAHDGGLKPIARQLDLTGLYRGHGGEMIEGADMHIPTPGVESPPSYDELALPSPPPPPISGKNAKGRAPDSPTPRPVAKKPKLAASSTKDVDAQQQQQQRKVPEDQVESGAESPPSALDTFRHELRQEMRERLTQLEEKLEARIDATAEELRREAGDDMDNLRHETDEATDARIDDQMLAVRDELREHMRDELRDVEERLRDRLCSASLSLNFD